MSEVLGIGVSCINTRWISQCEVVVCAKNPTISQCQVN